MKRDAVVTKLRKLAENADVSNVVCVKGGNR